ncbi:very short patch repair endonuclease [Alcaligenes sp. YSL9]|uniref:very short patch repair endonuclease n=1 Tax=Alcaligenes TaxID=507 RepID=UPI00266BD4C1|nr:DNA mismatch endonuclease Vsr [Alcaligenes sp. YSL9]
MIDIVDNVTRSKMMAGIRGKNTKPEMLIRRYLHSKGYRFRLHRKDLPGRPDLVLSKYKLAVFVHGCFWHRHAACFYARSPATRKEFWQKKLNQNVERDKKQEYLLIGLGWRVLTIWECGTRHCQDKLGEIEEMITGNESCMTWPRISPRPHSSSNQLSQ